MAAVTAAGEIRKAVSRDTGRPRTGPRASFRLASLPARVLPSRRPSCPGLRFDVSASSDMMTLMRTTLNLDEDLASVLRKAARRGGHSFTAVVNETLRAGLTKSGSQPRPRRYRLEPSSLGGACAGLDLDRAMRLADALEERAIADKLALRK